MKFFLLFLLMPFLMLADNYNVVIKYSSGKKIEIPTEQVSSIEFAANEVTPPVTNDDAFKSAPVVETHPFHSVISGMVSNKIFSDNDKLKICVYDTKFFTSKASRVYDEKVTDIDFSVKIIYLVPNTKYYYCLCDDDNNRLSDVYSFQTPPSRIPESCSYTINGQEFKMVKVTGLESGDFYIMQTELHKLDELVMDGVALSTCLCPSGAMYSHAYIVPFMLELRERTGIGFRFPTSEEWKYAAKGGSKSKGYKYSGSDNINEVAWYRDNYENNKDFKHALLKPNELGLYDMSGLYMELTQDNSTLNIRKLNVDGDMYGGCYSDREGGCTPDSYEKQKNTSSDRFVVPNYCAIRLVYSAE